MVAHKKWGLVISMPIFACHELGFLSLHTAVLLPTWDAPQQDPCLQFCPVQLWLMCIESIELCELFIGPSITVSLAKLSV